MSSSSYSQSEYTWYLKLKINNLAKRVASFESGNAYITLQQKLRSVISEQHREAEAHKKEVADLHAQIKANRERWYEVTDDIMEEHAKVVDAKDRRIAQLEALLAESDRQRDTAKGKESEWRSKYYAIATELEEANGLITKLTAQVNKDFENSSVPSSSQGPGRKKVHNSREKTDRRPGGQKGHEGHRLHQKAPTNSVNLPDPPEYVNDPDYYPTKDVVKRQKIIVSINVAIQEFAATVFRNRKTGSRVHAEFPDGYETDISYDPSVKGLAFILSEFGGMSAEKVHETLKEVSNGEISISKASIIGICKEFAEKSAPEKQKIIEDMMTSPVMNADFTNANVNGDAKQVLILGSPGTDSVMFIARDSKGHKGVQGMPLENYVGTAVHDHDKTFYSYGTKHQECMQHNIRYVIGSEQNEPELEWNKKMHGLFGEMIHYRKSLGDDELDPGIVAEFEDRYDDILALAKKEYDDTPPSEYYRDGYNLYLRLAEYKESELLFLHDRNVPPDNSLAERLARVFKRKQKQMMVIRSNENFIHHCDCLSVIHTYRYQGGDDLYGKIREVLSREKKRKPRFIPGVTSRKADV